MKLEPNHSSEMHTQLLYGHRVQWLEDVNAIWMKVECANDIPGYVLREQFIEIDEHHFHALNYSLMETLILSETYPVLFPGSYQTEEKVGDYFWKRNDRSRIRKQLESFLGAPYLWGGFTAAGIDCSGLSKWLYAYYHMPLPHSAADQMSAGKVVDFLQEVQCGDLAFFTNDASEINHVGILLSPSEIIHASESNGVVAIDSFDQEGIINRRSGRRTHTLRVIKTLLG